MAAALQAAQEAVALVPDDADVRNTLGIALYRQGDYAAAILELEKSERLYAIAEDEKNPPATPQTPLNWAFIAMSHHKLGHIEAAKAALDTLRGLMRDKDNKDDETSQGFLREAELLIEGRAGNAATQPAASQP